MKKDACGLGTKAIHAGNVGDYTPKKDDRILLKSDTGE